MEVGEEFDAKHETEKIQNKKKFLILLNVFKWFNYGFKYYIIMGICPINKKENIFSLVRAVNLGPD